MAIEIDVRKTEEKAISAIRFTNGLRLAIIDNDLKIIDDSGTPLVSIPKARIEDLAEAVQLAKRLWLTP